MTAAPETSTQLHRPVGIHTYGSSDAPSACSPRIPTHPEVIVPCSSSDEDCCDDEWEDECDDRAYRERHDFIARVKQFTLDATRCTRYDSEKVHEDVEFLLDELRAREHGTVMRVDLAEFYNKKQYGQQQLDLHRPPTTHKVQPPWLKSYSLNEPHEFIEQPMISTTDKRSPPCFCASTKTAPVLDLNQPVITTSWRPMIPDGADYMTSQLQASSAHHLHRAPHQSTVFLVRAPAAVLPDTSMPPPSHLLHHHHHVPFTTATTIAYQYFVPVLHTAVLPTTSAPTTLMHAQHGVHQTQVVVAPSTTVTVAEPLTPTTSSSFAITTASPAFNSCFDELRISASESPTPPLPTISEDNNARSVKQVDNNLVSPTKSQPARRIMGLGRGAPIQASSCRSWALADGPRLASPASRMSGSSNSSSAPVRNHIGLGRGRTVSHVLAMVRTE